MMTLGLRITLGIAAVIGVALLLTFQFPPVETVQRGYRGTGMDEIYNAAAVRNGMDINAIPASLPQLPASGPKAGAVYKNVQVLGDLSVGEFTRLMASITTWVAPTQGCAYCHNTNNMADDGLYTKVVARRMFQMVQHINANWKTHVAATGVTCWTCHRGNPVPSNIWFENPGEPHAVGMVETGTGKNEPSAAAGGSALPYDPFTPFLLHDADIRVEARQALPGSDLSSIKQTDWTYALMLHFTQALGVNCTYCHNSRQFSDWAQSTPQRVTAWYGIRMVRDINNNFLVPLTGVFPHARLGELGDAPKVNCGTCHKGAFKPLYGVSMLGDFPELAGPLPGAITGAANGPYTPKP